MYLGVSGFGARLKSASVADEPSEGAFRISTVHQATGEELSDQRILFVGESRTGLSRVRSRLSQGFDVNDQNILYVTQHPESLLQRLGEGITVTLPDGKKVILHVENKEVEPKK